MERAGISKLDQFLLDCPDFTQEDREAIMELVANSPDIKE